jgi:3-oxoacyl-[acyl-carrier-protein] synthase-3
MRATIVEMASTEGRLIALPASEALMRLVLCRNWGGSVQRRLEYWPVRSMDPERGAFIEAIEYELPLRTQTNAELAELHPNWNMGEIALRTGVKSRHWAAADETALDLAHRACNRLLARVGLERRAVDAVIFCTQTPDHVMPPNACLLQHRLVLSNRVVAFDISLACSGFVYGLYLAKAMILSGCNRVLLVTADTYSRLIHPDDRGPMTLFGDAAAATLISSGKASIGEFVLGTDGGGATAFIVPAGAARQPRTADTAIPHTDAYGNTRSAESIRMRGNAVLDFVKREIPRNISELLDKAETRLDAIDLFVLHQASNLSTYYVSRALSLPADKVFTNIDHVGNTVSASIAIALADAQTQGVLRPGMHVLLCGFGVGLSWGSCLVQWA